MRGGAWIEPRSTALGGVCVDGLPHSHKHKQKLKPNSVHSVFLFRIGSRTALLYIPLPRFVKNTSNWKDYLDDEIIDDQVHGHNTHTDSQYNKDKMAVERLGSILKHLTPGSPLASM